MDELMAMMMGFGDFGAPNYEPDLDFDSMRESLSGMNSAADGRMESYIDNLEFLQLQDSYAQWYQSADYDEEDDD